MKRIFIGLVGDFNEKMYTHIALNNAIEDCRKYLDFQVEAQWVHTSNLTGNNLDQERFQGPLDCSWFRLMQMTVSSRKPTDEPGSLSPCDASNKPRTFRWRPTIEARI